MSVHLSTLDRVELARRHLGNCLLCEHRCEVSRSSGERGPCHAGVEARVFRHRVECGEEPELVPSHLFYLSGCDLRCAFCIAEANAFDPSRGRLLTGEFLSDAIQWGKTQGARNLQWVGGEPTIHIPSILEAMSMCGDLPPIVWKSDFYGTPEAFQLLEGIIQVYVADFKFGNDQCAHRLARVSNYKAIVTRNLRLAAKQSDLIVRHLLLPGHTDCCFRPIVEWLRREMPNVKFSLRDGYQPRWQARRHFELASPLSKSEAQIARQIAGEAGLNVIA
jgi:putative pyruvate formate lyase activating enzyme